MSNRVVVIDYGIGNVFSVCNALREVGCDVNLTGNLAEIRNADRVILPGVGAFKRAMEALDKAGLADTIRAYVETGRPFLGICIGMQVLMERSSEFGAHSGLGFFKGSVERISETNSDGKRVRVPHIGWSPLVEENRWAGTALVDMSAKEDAVYFVHSYHCQPTDPAHLLASTVYDGVRVTAAIHRDNITGVQFHPERSGTVGQKTLRAFVSGSGKD